ncbi:hypothetical protein D9M71_704220 [compost metagenome]
MRTETLGLHPHRALATQQLTDFVARFTGDDGQVQVLALHQLPRTFAMDLDLNQRIGLGEA